MTVKNGIDVSAWQEKIDWNKAKAEVDFVILRLGYGKNTADKYAERNIAELNRLGIPYGVYWFSYAYTVEMARNEAKNAVACLEKFGAKLSYPVYFDWEYDSRKYAEKNGMNVDNTLLRNMATAFCEEVRTAGHYPGIYANPDYIKNYFGESIFEKYDLWLAHYVSKQNRDVKLWQYSSSGKVAGINGNVDMNRCYYDYGQHFGEEKEEPKKPAAVAYVPTVKEWQLAAIADGYKFPKYGADGMWGAECESVARKAVVKKRLFYTNKNLTKLVQKVVGVTADGLCGKNTDAAIREYQKKHGLTVDGCAGLATYKCMLNIR